MWMDARADWQVVTPQAFNLIENTVHVWRVPLNIFNPDHSDSAVFAIGTADIESRAFEHLLSANERLRADAYHFIGDRWAYIARRGVLRVILGQYLEKAPADLRFEYNEAGKPALAGQEGPEALRFNLSSSNQLALFAFTRGRDVGIDIEFMQPDFAYQPLAERFFSVQEQTDLYRCSHSERLEAFYACWTRKEAYVKARGGGLQIPLDRFVVSVGQPAHLVSVSPELADGRAWRLVHLNPAPGYVAALAAAGDDWELHMWG